MCPQNSFVPLLTELELNPFLLARWVKKLTRYKDHDDNRLQTVTPNLYVTLTHRK